MNSACASSSPRRRSSRSPPALLRPTRAKGSPGRRLSRARGNPRPATGCTPRSATRRSTRGAGLGAIDRSTTATAESAPLVADPPGRDPQSPDPARCAPDVLAYLPAATQRASGAPTVVSFTFAASAKAERPDAHSTALVAFDAFDVRLETAPCR